MAYKNLPTIQVNLGAFLVNFDHIEGYISHKPLVSIKGYGSHHDHQQSTLIPQTLPRRHLHHPPRPPLIVFHLQSNSSSAQRLILPLFTTTATNTTLLLSQLRNSITFLPPKDLSLSRTPEATFMSSLADIRLPNYPAHLLFPSPSYDDRLLCLNPYNRHDGSKNSYALAYPNALPHNSRLIQGLTIISDTLYRTQNIWHGLSTIVPFVGWYQRNKCVSPDRWVYFHHGQLRSKMANWVNALTEATTGDEVRIEDFEGYGGGAVCFERAVLFRHLEQGLEREGRERVYDMMRCKAREYCGVKVDGDNGGRIGVTLLLRIGERAFKNDSAVIGVFERGCEKVDGCATKVARSDNLIFCDQVRLLSETNILVSSYRAQMTNMIFMDKNSSVMEFFPKGWLEYAGVGQYVFRWLAAWSGMRHQGQWKDPLEGEKSPHNDNFKCFAFYKNGKVGHDEAYFATFMARVLDEVKASKNATKQESKGSTACQYCG